MSFNMRTRGGRRSARIHVRGDLCLYCGEPADLEDHFPPVSQTIKGLLLPACEECNALASAWHPFNLGARAALVHRKLAKRHKKIGRLPLWAASEVDELEGCLLDEVTRWRNGHLRLKRRLAWSAADYFHHIAAISDSAVYSAIIDFTRDYAVTLFDVGD